MLVKKEEEVRAVVEAFVMTPEVAKMLEVKVFRNLREEDPREKETSEEGVMLPPTCSLSVGVLTPTPTLPLASTLKY